MTIIEQLALQDKLTTLIEGGKARIKHTGQVVELKRVSEYGISIVLFRTGGEYFISNKFLEPVYSIH
ncbi:MAG: hypothetical protein COA54_14980 [Thiotrichaceae bacterium]|nr:MAG: hypothetical protein COA54_14980 [Thiotrichaceae bacterium]